MATEQTNAANSSNLTVEDRLKALYKLQRKMSEIDKIRIVRGELPLEVKELEDNVVGLQAHLERIDRKIDQANHDIASQKLKIEEANTIISKKEEEKNNVRNNREYDALCKEIEFQSLEIQLSEKHIRNFYKDIEREEENKAIKSRQLEDRIQDLEAKKSELDSIIEEYKTDEENLLQEVAEIEPLIEERLLKAFHRIRSNAKNGLSVVTVERDSCGGCFNKIPPQRQLDVKMHKKVIVCEYCGRILVDQAMADEYDGIVSED